MKTTGCVLDLAGGAGTVLRDRSVMRNHGTLSAATMRRTLPNGLEVIEFNGSNQKVQLTNTITIPTTSGDATLLVWAKRDTTAAQAALFGDDAADEKYWGFEADDDLYWETDTATDVMNDTPTTTDTLWHLWAFVLTAGTGQFYEDGVAFGATDTFIDDTPLSQIGLANTAWDWDGLMWRPRVYTASLPELVGKIYSDEKAQFGK